MVGVGLGSPRFNSKRSLARASDQDDCTLVTKGTLLYQINGEPPIFTAGHAFWTWFVQWREGATNLGCTAPVFRVVHVSPRTAFR